MSDITDLTRAFCADDFGEGDGDFEKCDQKMDLNNAYRVVEELEDWKERQQKLFRSILAGKERKHIAFLSEEWDKRRMVLQSQLEQSIDKCDALATQLQSAHQEAIASELASRQIERKLVAEMDEVERMYEAKLISLKEASRRVEGDLHHKVKLMDIDKSLLEERLSVLKRENKELIEKYERIKKDIADVKKNSLKKDQIRSLMKQLRSCEDKLNNVVQSKEYFKDEWARAARVVHHFKEENQQNISNRIQMYKTQIDNTTGGDLSGILKKLKERIMNVNLDDDMAEPLLTQRSQPNLGDHGNSSRINSLNYYFPPNSARYSSGGNDTSSAFHHHIDFLMPSRSNSEVSTNQSSDGNPLTKLSFLDSLALPDLNLSCNPRHNHTLSENLIQTNTQKKPLIKNCFSDNDISR